MRRRWWAKVLWCRLEHAMATKIAAVGGDTTQQQWAIRRIVSRKNNIARVILHS